MRGFVRDEAGPSVSVAVAMNGRLVFAHAQGFADRARRIAATPNTAYSIASITKPVVATAVMRLVEAGAIGLDESANRYLGRARLQDWQGDADQVTVRQLLSHTAGLPEHLDFHYVDEAPAVPPMDITVARYGRVAFEPGTLYQYANLGYGVLASIVANQSGRPFGDAVRRAVFSPLGMNQSSMRGTTAPRGAAQRHDARGRVLPDYSMFEIDGASAAYASAADLVRFGLLHLGVRQSRGAHAPVSGRGVALMQERMTPADGPAYGLGWELGQERGVPVVTHSGGMPGVRARLTLVPSRQAVIVVLVNGEAWPAALYERLLSIVGLPQARPSAPPAQEGAGAPAGIPGGFAGQWRGQLRTYESTTPFALLVDSDGHAFAALGDAALARVEDLTYVDGFLYGYVAGTVPTADAHRRPGKVWMQLRMEGAAGAANIAEGTRALVGAIYQGSAADGRERYTLGAPVRLSREP
jgi:CubicO group peptidase (beta-lactamase class C family)